MLALAEPSVTVLAAATGPSTTCAPRNRRTTTPRRCMSGISRPSPSTSTRRCGLAPCAAPAVCCVLSAPGAVPARGAADELRGAPGAALAAGSPRRVSAAGAAEALEQPQGDGAVAVALLQLPGQARRHPRSTRPASSPPLRAVRRAAALCASDVTEPPAAGQQAPDSLWGGAGITSSGTRCTRCRTWA